MAQVNKQAIAAAFGRAASQYEQHASLQQHSADALLTLLTGRQFASVLDAGCGPGRMSRYWRERGSEVTALDLSLPMLQQARDRQAAHHYLLADIEAIPHDAEVFDLAWSNLAVQWCGDLRDALSELYRVVRPGGVVRLPPCARGRCRSCVRHGRPSIIALTRIAFCRKRPLTTRCAAGGRFVILRR